MSNETDLSPLVSGSSAWSAVDPRTLLNRAARSIGAGSSTDQGWSPQIQSAAPPISMAGGFPDSETIPVQELLQALRSVAETSASEALRYGGTLGFEGLRACLAEKSRREDGLEQGPENFVLTNGSSAAIDLVCRTFLNPGDVVVTESPGFSGSLRTVRGNLGRLEPVRVDDDGMDTDDLDRVLASLTAQGTPAKLIYSGPDFQNPTGTCLTLERRLQLLEIAARHRALILEDDAYGDLYFDVKPLPSLYALAGGEGVLRAGSFSKTIATGLRVGWLQGRADFVAACNHMRFDMGGSPLLQRALATFISSGRWEEHTAEMRELYAAKCAALSEALIDECESFVRFQRPAGGYFLWLECDEGFSARRVVEAAAQEGLICVPGHHFYLEATSDRYVRIAFTNAPITTLAEAARRLRAAFERLAG